MIVSVIEDYQEGDVIFSRKKSGGYFEGVFLYLCFLRQAFHACVYANKYKMKICCARVATILS
jgi:hypothetical protein